MQEHEIRTALAPFKLGQALEAVHLHDGLVQVTIAMPRERAAAFEPTRQRIEHTLALIPGVKNAAVILTAHKPAPPPAAQPQAAAPPLATHIIAVASGKGGVGKSTVAVNLAVALAQSGMKVGLLDADIHGPSLPRMLGLNAKPAIVNNRMQPLHAWGLTAMSIGFLVEEQTAMIWRGPMVTGALNQMMTQVDWGVLDILVIDMPPGTGDVQLSLAQRANLAGAVIVSTPQDIALIDARRGAAMFAQVRIPVLGLVENMSQFTCPKCGQTTEIFGHGGAAAEAAAMGVPLLGEVPLQLDIRQTSDAGTPITAAEPDSAAAAAFRAIAAAVKAGLAAPRAAPTISFE
jgi:ATP-binding protein involved in chromosome partitioning